MYIFIFKTDNTFTILDLVALLLTSASLDSKYNLPLRLQ